MTRRAAHQERTRNSTARRYLTGLLAALTAATLGAARAPSHLAENPPVTANRTIPRVEAPQPWRGFSTAPADAEITAVRAFPEPLVPIGTTTPDDNRAVAAAVSALLKSADRMNPVPLTEFVAEYPSSPWRASVLANLGAMYRRQGYITRALEAWDAAWELAKDAPTARGRAIANFAIGEALDFAVELGQRSLIEPRIMAIGTRTIPGAAGGKVDLARFALARADQDPQSSVPSGQGAVRALLEDRGIRLMPASFRRAEQRREMLTLPRMRRLARDAGLATILARRGTGSLIVPSIVHLRMNYVTTLLQYDAGRGAYLVRDPAFGGERWIAEGVLSDEMSGLALLPGDRLPAGWVAVSEAEAQTSGGGAWCPVASPDPTAPPCDPECCTPPCNGPGGMPRYSLNVINAGLLITDLPVAYVPVRGPSVDLTLRYHSRDVLQPQIFAYGNVGYRWEHSWVSFIEEVPEVAGPSGGYHPEYVDVHLRGGGSESLLGPPAAGGSYGTFWRSRSTLVRVSQTPIRYERRLPDGSLEVYAQPDNAPAGQWRRVFLTDVVDPQGHTLHLTYDAQLRLAAITDATGLVTTLAYEWGRIR